MVYNQWENDQIKIVKTPALAVLTLDCVTYPNCIWEHEKVPEYTVLRAWEHPLNCIQNKNHAHISNMHIHPMSTTLRNTNFSN